MFVFICPLRRNINTLRLVFYIPNKIDFRSEINFSLEINHPFPVNVLRVRGHVLQQYLRPVKVGIFWFHAD